MDGMEREKVWHVRIAVAAALVGCAGVVSGLRHELGPVSYTHLTLTTKRIV